MWPVKPNSAKVRVPLGNHNPCPGTRLAVGQALAQAAPRRYFPGWRAQVSCPCSWRRHDQTDGHTMAFGQQAPLDPVFTAIRGVGARLFPTQRRFGRRAIHTGKRPVDALQFIELLHTRLPELENHIRLHPRLIPIMGGRCGTIGLIQRLPLTTGAQDVEDGIGARPIRHTRPTAAETVRVHMDRQEGQQDRPQGIGNPKVGRRFVVSCTGTSR